MLARRRPRTTPAPGPCWTAFPPASCSGSTTGTPPPWPPRGPGGSFWTGTTRPWPSAAGPCKLCPSCAPEGCRFPGKAVPAMEACGIDVFATARAHGLEVRTLRVLGEERNHFGLILVE
ncbi:MAG: DUF2284 domain-containing protein [Flavonifractor plautii]